jgi:hypothetical protein
MTYYENRQQNIENLTARGFDLSYPTRAHVTVRPKCSQCEAVVVNGTACHEHGCPNAKHECSGCNELLPRNVKYCQDCR